MTSRIISTIRLFYAVLFLDDAHKSPFVYIANVYAKNQTDAFSILYEELSTAARPHIFRAWEDQYNPIHEIDPNNPPTAEELARPVSEFQAVNERYLTACAGSPNPNGFIFDRTAALLQAYTLTRYNQVHQSEEPPNPIVIAELDAQIHALLWQIYEVR